jgi:NAD(P)-dependent dehydrogenase (short-subunit alcohol dehydrogenase family)
MRIGRKGGSVQAIAANACDSAKTAAVVGEVMAAHGRIDDLVCVVGQTLKREPTEMTDESWRQFIDINLSSAFYGVRAVLPHMEQAKYGRIIFIGSAVVHDGGGGAIDYVASKSGLVGMTAYLARNYARRGIVANTVHPCVVDTDLFRERYSDPVKRQQLIDQVPVGRLGTPADTATLVAYLLSPLGDFICGQAILVDGGRTMF